MVNNINKTIIAIIISLITVTNVFAKTQSEALSNYYEGMRLFDTNNFENAKIKLNKALDLNGSLAFANVVLGMIASSNGNYNEAINLFKKYLDAPNDLSLVSSVRIKLSYCYMKTEQWEDAVSELKKIPENEHDSQYSEAYANVYITQMESIRNIKKRNSVLYDECNKAIKLLEAEKILHPENKWVRNSLGRAYILVNIRDGKCDISILKQAEDNFNESINKNINLGKYIYFNLAVAQYLIASCYDNNAWEGNSNKCECLKNSVDYFEKSKTNILTAISLDNNFIKALNQKQLIEQDETKTKLDLQKCKKK